MIEREMNNYTGPRWVGPLFLFLFLGVGFFLVLCSVADMEIEWE